MTSDRNNRGIQQMPIDLVSPDKLDSETPLNYNEISCLVGSLYIDANHKIKNIEEQAKALIDSLRRRISELMEDNMRLKEELKRYSNGGNREGFITQSRDGIESSENNIGTSKV